MSEGGVVESIDDIGATSVPGLPGQACVDIRLTVWPFPLEAGDQVGLERQGWAGDVRWHVVRACFGAYNIHDAMNIHP